MRIRQLKLQIKATIFIHLALPVPSPLPVPQCYQTLEEQQQPIFSGIQHRQTSPSCPGAQPLHTRPLHPPLHQPGQQDAPWLRAQQKLLQPALPPWARQQCLLGSQQGPAHSALTCLRSGVMRIRTKICSSKLPVLGSILLSWMMSGRRMWAPLLLQPPRQCAAHLWRKRRLCLTR